MLALREMGYLARELTKEEVFHSGAIKKVHKGRGLAFALLGAAILVIYGIIPTSGAGR
jgi:hypothetical protein